ncbi:MAG: aminodeoxychorismate synthase component I [Bacteroidia bacterium]|nr:aminodeoxychorismate synthase component I [Bacteroidia bacterium]NNK71663.1 aminodeoxychorismate synthase component I [Flavobacteriaceae bacterium]
MRIKQKVDIDDLEEFKSQLISWGQDFDCCLWLDSNRYDSAYTNYEGIMAIGNQTSISTVYSGGFEALSDFRRKSRDWIFGYLSYDMKNDIEELSSDNHDGLRFQDLFFFQPKKIIFVSKNKAVFSYLPAYASELQDDINAIQKGISSTGNAHVPVKISMRMTKDEYFARLDDILKHIHRGDIYEMNFCQEFYADNTKIDPLQTYNRLNAISNAPFAAFMRLGQQYIMSASPERYLQKIANHVISQPIKGTAPRSKNQAEDNLLRHSLKTDIKERSENIMIVDLVRNDLAKTAVKGSVNVEELCEIYTFDQVHQMISTVTSEINADTDAVDIIKSTFPMGSMTGAPKISAMNLIEKYEKTRRGVYSGAIGYFEPNGNFDLSVVIRTILYNARNAYVSFSVGGAITAKSKPIKEYEECLIKAKAMRMVLEGSLPDSQR